VHPRKYNKKLILALRPRDTVGLQGEVMYQKKELSQMTKIALEKIKAKKISVRKKFRNFEVVKLEDGIYLYSLIDEYPNQSYFEKELGEMPDLKSVLLVGSYWFIADITFSNFGWFTHYQLDFGKRLNDTIKTMEKINFRHNFGEENFYFYAHTQTIELDEPLTNKIYEEIIFIIVNYCVANNLVCSRI